MQINSVLHISQESGFFAKWIKCPGDYHRIFLKPVAWICNYVDCPGGKVRASIGSVTPVIYTALTNGEHCWVMNIHQVLASGLIWDDVWRTFVQGMLLFSAQQVMGVTGPHLLAIVSGVAGQSCRESNHGFRTLIATMHFVVLQLPWNSCHYRALLGTGNVLGSFWKVIIRMGGIGEMLQMLLATPSVAGVDLLGPVRNLPPPMRPTPLPLYSYRRRLQAPGTIA